MTNKLGIILGIIVLAIVLATAPIPLTLTLQNPPETVTIYPNLLFAVPLALFAALLLLYGLSANGGENPKPSMQ